MEPTTGDEITPTEELSTPDYLAALTEIASGEKTFEQVGLSPNSLLFLEAMLKMRDLGRKLESKSEDLL